MRIPLPGSPFTGIPDVSDTLFALVIARGLLLLQQGDDEATTAYLQSVFSPSRIFIVSDYHPPYFAIERTNEVIVGICGVQSKTDIAKLLIAYTLPSPQNLLPTVTLPTYYRAVEGRARLDQVGLINGKPLILCGHSWGGAIAIAIADLLETSLGLEGQKVQVLTFGSPKPGHKQLYDDLQSVRLTRWMAHNDPVPFLPPTREEMGLEHDTLGIPFERFGFWQQVGQGRHVTGQGPYKIRLLPPLSGRPSITLVGEWFVLFRFPPLYEHSIVNYRTLLEGQIAILPDGTVESAVQPAATPLAPVAAGSGLGALGELPLSTPGQIGKPVAPTVHRVGTGWGVFWNGFLIATSMSKNRCQIVAKAFTRSFRRLYFMDGVDAAMLSSALDDMVTACSVGSDGTPGPLP